jgi:putative ABC transport system permease protein
MLKNYMMTSLRNLKKYKGYSFICVSGLAVGMVCCILILMWVHYDFSFDRFHKNAKNIYRVISEITDSNGIINNARTPTPTGPTLKDEYPEVVNFTRFQGVDRWNFQYGDKRFDDISLSFVDPSFFEIFSFSFVRGDVKTAFSDRYNLIITEKMAKKFFGDEDPMDKVIKIWTLDFKVAGIIKNVPETSHMRFDCIFPIINMAEFWDIDFKSWKGRMWFYTYIQLQENSNWKELNKKISGLVKRPYPESNLRVFLQPLLDVHLRSDFKLDLDNYKQGNITYIYFFSISAIFILLIACFGFMNLVTARFCDRALEVGMRKVVGASRKNLIQQFYLESLLSSFIALFLALLLTRFFLPVFNELTQRELTLNLIFSGNTQFVIELIGLTLLTGLIAGSYPALFLSSLPPIAILKGAIGTLWRRAILRKAMVIFQFSLVIFLIIGVIGVSRQLNYINRKDLGFNSDNIAVLLAVHEFELDDRAKKNEFLENPNILNVSLSVPPTEMQDPIDNVGWEGKNPVQKFTIYPVHVDYEFFDTFGMKMAEGRYFSRKFPTDTSNYILNETAVRMMGLKAPVGKRFAIGNQWGIIIGVMKDYHHGSLHSSIEPVVLKLFYQGFVQKVCVKMSPNNIPDTIKYIEALYKKYSPDYIFRYEFLNDTINTFYKTDRNVGTILIYFSFLSMFIACLGLLGLISYTVEQKSKEVVIRKVSGALVSGIVWLFAKQFMKWVAIAFIIACPVAWYMMKSWLQNFAYRVSIEWWMFVLSGIVALVIALLTVSYQVIKAARTNPVETLRYE